MVNLLQNRDGLPDAIIDDPRFFELYGSEKEDIPEGWNNPATWKSLDEIPPEKYFGFAIGNNSNYLFIDCDHVIDGNGKIIPWVKEVLGRITKVSNTYYEYSKSKTGFHLICDLGEYAESFGMESNGYDQIIIQMDPYEYKILPKEEREKIPKIEFFYHTNGRYVYLTGQHEKLYEVAKDENAASIFRELLQVRDEYHQRFCKGATASSNLGKAGMKFTISKIQKKEILEALPYISASARDTWVKVGIALNNCGIPFEVWDNWSQWSDQRAGIRCDKYNPEETPKIWKSFINSKSNYNAGTIFKLAKSAGWRSSYINQSDKPVELPKLAYAENGKVLQTIRNFEIALSTDKRFTGKLKYNLFDRQEYLTGSVPWETVENYRAWSSADDSALLSILQTDYGLTNRLNYYDALKNVCRLNKYHPVRDMLESFEYRGKGYIRKLLPYFLGCEDSDYNFEVMKLFMLGAVSRIFQPGCKFDYCPIFTGSQGIGKSTFLRMLALDDNWFNDSLNDMDSEKTAQYLTGSWIIELGELKAFAKTGGGVDSVKRFLSATQDKYRVPYERRADVFLRQCVFAGTTNKDDFLQDQTGNRRFLVVKCGSIPIEGNLFDISCMDLIRSAWAEALYIYKEEKPTLTLPSYCIEQAEALQNEAMTDDGTRGLIEVYLEGVDETCAIDIWHYALKHGSDTKPKGWESTEITSILRQLGWECVGSRKFVHPIKYEAGGQWVVNGVNYGKQKVFRKRSI